MQEITCWFGLPVIIAAAGSHAPKQHVTHHIAAVKELFQLRQ